MIVVYIFKQDTFSKWYINNKFGLKVLRKVYMECCLFQELDNI